MAKQVEFYELLCAMHVYTFVKVEGITARLTLIRDENRHEFAKDERDVTSVCVTEM